MVRAFHDGKELVYFGTSEKERSQSARMLVFDLASRQSRELAPGFRIDPGGSWAPLDVAPVLAARVDEARRAVARSRCSTRRLYRFRHRCWFDSMKSTL